jgi:hypothetical protein
MHNIAYMMHNIAYTYMIRLPYHVCTTLPT